LCQVTPRFGLGIVLTIFNGRTAHAIGHEFRDPFARTHWNAVVLASNNKGALVPRQKLLPYFLLPPAHIYAVARALLHTTTLEICATTIGHQAVEEFFLILVPIPEKEVPVY